MIQYCVCITFPAPNPMTTSHHLGQNFVDHCRWKTRFDRNAIPILFNTLELGKDIFNAKNLNLILVNKQRQTHSGPQKLAYCMLYKVNKSVREFLAVLQSNLFPVMRTRQQCPQNMQIKANSVEILALRYTVKT